MKTFLLILFTLLFLPLPVQANLCETRAFSSIVGVESYPLALLRETKFLLNREITPAEISAIEQANHLKRGSSRPEGVHLRAKVQILKKAGFSKTEVRKLIENNIVWTRILSPEEALLKALKVGKEDIYFKEGAPSKPARILKVIRETDEHFEVSAEALMVDGFLKTGAVDIFKDFRNSDEVIILHPSTQVLFSVSRSKKPKINREDIKILLPTREEAKLKEKGFGPAWTRGLDKLNEWMAVRRQLQDLRANPRTTHIPYFADQIPAHLGFAKEGLGSSISQQKSIDLSNLVRTAKKAILEEKVTYEWWLNFNYQISSLLSAHLHIIFLATSEPSIANFISRFPLEMAVPTIYGELGIITLNRAQSEGIYPLGLISQSKEVHGELHSPEEFMGHDIGHSVFVVSLLNDLQYSIGHRLKHKKMLEFMGHLPTEKRKRAELVYFAHTHEFGSNIFFEHKKPDKEKVNDDMSMGVYQLFYGHEALLRMAGLGKEYSDLKSQEDRLQYIREHITEPFMREVYAPAFP